MTKQPKSIPYEFVLDLLYPLEVEIKPMFGCFSLYTKEKLVLFLRDRDEDPDENGVWVAATRDGYESLIEDLQFGRPEVESAGPMAKRWLKIGAAGEAFEEQVRSVCDLIVQGDPRIGR